MGVEASADVVLRGHKRGCVCWYARLACASVGASPPPPSRDVPMRAFACVLTVSPVYQVALYLGLEDYILSAPRDNLFSQNREGILGSAGTVHSHPLLRELAGTAAPCCDSMGHVKPTALMAKHSLLCGVGCQVSWRSSCLAWRWADA